MKRTRYSIGVAAKRLGVSTKTLLRAEEAERVRFTRQGKGWRFISAADLEMAPALSIAVAARLLGISSGRLRGWAVRVERKSPPPFRRGTKARWFSLFSLRVFGANRGIGLMAHYRPSVWLVRERGDVKRVERGPLMTTYIPRLHE